MLDKDKRAAQIRQLTVSLVIDFRYGKIPQEIPTERQRQLAALVNNFPNSENARTEGRLRALSLMGRRNSG